MLDIYSKMKFMCFSLLNRSFAYETIKDRLPIIVTRIVDFLARHRAKIGKELGEVSVEFFFECQIII
jgi:hypothetical protein